VPSYLCCQITFEIFRDPVITPSGVTFERAVLLEHLHKVSLFFYLCVHFLKEVVYFIHLEVELLTVSMGNVYACVRLNVVLELIHTLRHLMIFYLVKEMLSTKPKKSCCSLWIISYIMMVIEYLISYIQFGSDGFSLCTGGTILLHQMI
jgi:hypothetical protein